MYLGKKKSIGKRIRILYLAIFLASLVIVYHLAKLQIVKGNENFLLSSAIKTSQDVILAPRGLIYDKNGNPLVVNSPTYKLIINLSELPQDKEQGVIQILSEILNTDKDKLWQDFLAKSRDADNSRVKLSEITLLNNIDRDKVISIYSRLDELPSVSIDSGTTRSYINGSLLTHVVGYIRNVTEKEVASGQYTSSDSIGATGIELFYDAVLRGQNGKKMLEVDKTGSSSHELLPVNPVSGKSVRLSIDSTWQQSLTDALEKGIRVNNASGGAAIIMDIHTGEILALVSLPSFDPNAIVQGLSASEYASLSQDLNLPLYNRAISLTVPPGSTFKTIVASAALQENEITPSTYFNSNGCMDLGGGYQFCEAGKRILGNLDMYHALSRSSNIYFCNVMLRLGIDKLDSYASEFNIGATTGIDLPAEAAGTMTSRELKLSLQNEQWYLGDDCNTAIGQSLTQVSPLQMVLWVSAIANGGTYYKPHIASAIINEDQNTEEIITPEVIRKLSIDEKNLEFVREGMHLAVTDPLGSAFPLRGFNSDPAAKTGSAEVLRKVNGQFVRQAHSWVSGFFPYNEPKYAFVVYLEYGGWGYQSAQVMKDFFTWYEK